MLAKVINSKSFYFGRLMEVTETSKKTYDDGSPLYVSLRDGANELHFMGSEVRILDTPDAPNQ